MDTSSGQQVAPDGPPKSKQGTVMKKLSRLISPNKKTSKPSPRKQASLLPKDGNRDVKGRLDFLFAQAEATLGELLMQADASFNVRSTFQDDCHSFQRYLQIPLDCPQSDSHQNCVSAAKLGGSFGKIPAEAGKRHLRRNSLSRIWQQVGGSVFCGSGAMKTLAREEMELRGMGPMPQSPSATYLAEKVNGDMATDESCCQSVVAESILMQREKTVDVDLVHVDLIDEVEQIYIKDCMPQTSQDMSSIQHCGMATPEVAAECIVSEILSVNSAVEVSDGQEDDGRIRCPANGATDCNLKDNRNELLVPREDGHGCTRLNTMLDASPNLADNYQSREIKTEVMAEAASSGASASTNWSFHSRPESARNSIRVSLKALLHEETAGVGKNGGKQMGELQAMARSDEESLECKEPLALNCCVCMVRRNGAALIPCGHTFCRICSKQLYANRGSCPLCNDLIVQLLDIF